ncbi:BamA/TamA family outer membrane protein [Novosphingobium sp.]|uniref:BamA/TamA family outer membrane protein n=1 Tax=Novosphingobium sp. TaxID=1874826 RepID=UPI00286DA7FF|nr:BamA/TamA family outer membrane protein [Novosphingobium sp.]
MTLGHTRLLAISLLAGATQIAIPAAAQTRPAPAGTQTVPSPPPGANLPVIEPIVPDAEFEKAIPAISPDDDPELSRPLESIDEFERRLAAQQPGETNPASTTITDPAAEAETPAPAPIGSAPVRDAELAAPLPPLETFKVEPATFAEPEKDTRDVEVAYLVQVNGLGDAAEADGLEGRFNDASALKGGKGKAANAAQVSSRAGEDIVLLKKLLAAEGWMDSRVISRIEQPQAEAGKPLTVVFDVVPGKRFAFTSVEIDAAPTIPATLIRDNLALQVGEPVIAERVLGAEAKVALALPENGYPFASVGQRDVLLDQDTGGADYTLPVAVGPRGSFGAIVSSGKEAFGADHVEVLARFKPGELYDSRKVDDLRQALIATGLFRSIGVEPKGTGKPGPDGTEVVDLAVQQEAGPPRVIAASAGYNTGEGFRIEGSWTHRNLFPPEGALIVSGVAGTQEQGAGVTFRRSNAGKRDRSFELGLDLNHSSYDAFSAYTGRLAARVSYDSTPLWQKRLTYAYGAQIIGTNESVYDVTLGARERRTYAIAGLTGQIGLDTTDSLLDPKEGFRVTALVEPEGSLQRGFSPYARVQLDGSAYYPVGKNLVVAGRMRVASIQGVDLDDLAPSRRLFAGGGGSVRGFAYQQLGPLDPAGDPTGGRSLNEAAFEVRYRFGDYGVVAFADVGQSYATSLPDFSNLRAGVGLGARLYTNFGPMRVDLATPLARRPGEGWLNVYVSIGQAF